MDRCVGKRGRRLSTGISSRNAGLGWRIMFTRVRAVAAKEFGALVRRPQLLILLLLGPVLIMAAFALSFRADKAKPSAVVVVQPGSAGAELFERFRPRFVSHIDFQGTVESVEEADRLIKSGQVDAAIIIPSNSPPARYS